MCVHAESAVVGMCGLSSRQQGVYARWCGCGSGVGCGDVSVGCGVWGAMDVWCGVVVACCCGGVGGGRLQLAVRQPQV